ncbi:hypothetical protein MPNT_50025 [Candidatus Methylacidithermus pantelleriae]|uniref:Uncharacterized protein n=1 Tax=Candidatus Methylacidithermus pantelleriae TaxID=2744239 RepID=A0A8J2BVG2_9BACT|nr:hypothetical protein MPNT_50025 [Candidatus Methylacidithermus pantelleriae]
MDDVMALVPFGGLAFLVFRCVRRVGYRLSPRRFEVVGKGT